VNRIKEHRERKLLTQDELAALLGVTSGTVSSWERGVAKPRLRMIRALAKRLGVSVDDLGYGGQ
jgi:transcriptional regulator with XRE-family HTH domain